MFPALIIDSSFDWEYISAVVLVRSIDFKIKPHIASLPNSKRFQITANALQFIEENGYGICVHAKIHDLVKIYKHGHSKSRAWRIAIKTQLFRIKQHLQSKRIKFESIIADNEFYYFDREIRSIFGKIAIHYGKSELILFADALAYANKRYKRLLKKFKNITEL